MSQIVIISIAAAAIGLVAAAFARRRLFVGGGAVLAGAAVCALVWSRPSTARFERQAKQVEDLCSNVASRLHRFGANQQTEDLRKQYPWSVQAIVWLELADEVDDIEPLCFPDSESPCLPASITGLPPASFDLVRPHLERVENALKKHTGCKPAATEAAPASR